MPSDYTSHLSGSTGPIPPRADTTVPIPTITLCSFCDPNNKGWGSKQVYEATRLDLKKWWARLKGVPVDQVYETHGLDYITLISAHYDKKQAPSLPASVVQRVRDLTRYILAGNNAGDNTLMRMGRLARAVESELEKHNAE